MNPCLRNFLIFLRFFSCKWAFTIRVHCFMVPWSTCLYHYVPHYPIPFLIITQSQWTATHLCPSLNRFTSVKTCFKKAVFVECSQANPNIFGCRKFQALISDFGLSPGCSWMLRSLTPDKSRGWERPAGVGSVVMGMRMMIIWDYMYPICSMYSIFTYIWAIYGVNVGKYSIHGAYGYTKY